MCRVTQPRAFPVRRTNHARQRRGETAGVGGEQGKKKRKDSSEEARKETTCVCPRRIVHLGKRKREIERETEKKSERERANKIL